MGNSKISRAAAERKHLSPGCAVRWNANGRAAFDLQNPNICGTYCGASIVEGFANVLWDGRASQDTIDLDFIETVQQRVREA